MVLSEIMLKPPNGSESRPRQGMHRRSTTLVSCTTKRKVLRKIKLKQSSTTEKREKREKRESGTAAEAGHAMAQCILR